MIEGSSSTMNNNSSESSDSPRLSSPPTPTIVIPKTTGGKLPPPGDTLHRAIHRISLAAISHNFSEVSSAANRQRCDVICVTKADSYGHGAIATALYLADSMGADAFAVATLEEAIALRKAFQDPSTGTGHGSESIVSAPVATRLPMTQSHQKLTLLFTGNGGEKHSDESITVSTLPTTTTNFGGSRGRSRRPSVIRIIVLGPPVGFPRCFDDYFHHNIEVMISGPEVARALYQWANDPEERKRNIVERTATEAKAMALKGHSGIPSRAAPKAIAERQESNISDASTSENSQSSGRQRNARQAQHAAATLGNVTGSDLAKEVREILRNQQVHAESISAQPVLIPKTNSVGTPQTMDSSHVTPVSSEADLYAKGSNGIATNTVVFAGIEEAARTSRNIQKRVASGIFTESDDDYEDSGDANDGAKDAPHASLSTLNINGKLRAPTNRNKKALAPIGIQRRRLRYHILVDSGMGRLGFKTDPLHTDEQGKRRDAVESIKELVDLEVKHDCPIEFFGMVTHMADANSTSTYTNDQIKRFKSLLNRVRANGMSVPTISTDNSSALLTTTLTHFDSKALLTQEYADTRGFVRIGGAIYGQRPSFPQLRAVSTLIASVRHVAVLKKGESVGYDRAYVADRKVRIATLTMGFADGYPRELGNKNGQVAIRGHIFPVVGNVCMDMMMVELGDAGDKASVGAQVVVGDTAILWGPGDDEDGEGLVPLREIANRLKTTQSALTCGLNKERVRRQYV